MSTVISAGTTTNTAYNVNADTSGSMVLATGSGPTTAVTISSSQVATFAQAPVLPSGSIPQAALGANVAGNGPAFLAYQSSGQSITNGSFTKIQWQAKAFDTNSNFDATTNYRFTPTVAGYYQFIVGVGMTIASQVETNITLYKNGSPTATMVDIIVPLGRSAVGAYLLYLNGSTDYVEIYYYTSVAGTTNTGSGTTYFSGFLARSA